MAELTLERIAELRGIATACVEEGERWSIGPTELLRLLDAAERGLTNDRKAILLVASVGDVQNEAYAQAPIVTEFGLGRADGLSWAAAHFRDELKSLGIWREAADALEQQEPTDADR